MNWTVEVSHSNRLPDEYRWHRKQKILAYLVASLITGAYLFRASVGASLLLGEDAEGAQFLTYLALIPAGIYALMLSGSRVRPFGLLFLVATGASVVTSELVSVSFERWIGWSLLLISVGPVLASAGTREYRAVVDQIARAVFCACAFGSFIWWAGGLPSVGRGSFSGMMSHSMLLAPIAALGAIECVIRAHLHRHFMWVCLAAVAGSVTLLAGSRIAVVALIAGICAALTARYRWKFFVPFTFITLGLFPFASESNSDALLLKLPADMSYNFFVKGAGNSREGLWQARLEEFTMRPITGVGFAAQIIRSRDDVDLTKSEPGSCYMAVLAMTGLVGSVAFVALVGSVLVSILQRWSKLSGAQHLWISGYGTFWTVHMIAEGYIFGVGSILCLLFWLFMGRLADLGDPEPASGRMSGSLKE